MKSAVEKLGPTRVKLSVEVPYEELKPSVDEAYKAIGSQIQVPGFRKGKVPARIIDQRIGRPAVLQEAINEALPTFYSQALVENELRPMGQPEVEVTEVPVDDEQPLKFDAELDTAPEFDLPDFSQITVEVDPFEVADEDVDKEFDALRERFGTLAGVDRAAADGDSVTIDLKATIDDEDIDDVSGINYVIGSGNMLEGMDEALAGLSAGDTKTFKAPLAGGEHQGRDADITVTVQAVKERQLPELDDDFAQMASEHDTLDEMRAEVTEQVTRTKRFEQGVQARDKALDHLLETLDLPMPEKVIESEVHQHLENEDRLEDDEHRAEVDESTRKSLKTQLILDKLVERDDVQVSQEELIEYIVMSASQYGMDPNQFAQTLDQQGQVPAIMGEVARRKALASILDEIKVVDTDGNDVDLSELDDDEDEDTEGATAEAADESDESADDSSQEPSDEKKDDATV
ncbi:trigger factor [Flexivirga endophytica]|uniref:Trigger factor n=1 Tax=Flexivirga endophytica TaxID=1849103 RepID=A0A916WP59_9MICO|nr:trigger factor [Flexivirga endophytica]GGB16641.1 trigger factor [Flexivirga endophytica]GHB38910.1 trigger factor [Flexivirga endophytica]